MRLETDRTIIREFVRNDLDDLQEILLIQSKRYVTNHIEWEIPAGRIEQGESAENAAQRECLEKTAWGKSGWKSMRKHG